MKIKALVLRQPNELATEDRPAPVPGPAEAVVRVAYAGVCHTDFFVMSGEYAGTKYPTVLGHEFSGVVEHCGDTVTNIRPGDRVTSLCYSYCGTCPACRLGRHNACRPFVGIPFQMDGAFQEMVALPSSMLYRVPESVSLLDASLTEPAANGYAAAERADILPGESVVIIGPGPIGLLALQAAALRHPRSLIMLGTRPERLALAARLGASHIVNVRETDPYEAVMNHTGGAGVDAVLFCGGGQDAWELAGRMLAPYGRVVVEALPERCDTAWQVTVFELTSKQISYLGASAFTGSQFGTTLELMRSGKIDVNPLITHRFPLEEYREAFETAEKRKGGAMKVVFTLNEEVSECSK